ncbi:MAG: FkbM family methyltransferase [Paracoccaceae bacterium]
MTDSLANIWHVGAMHGRLRVVDVGANPIEGDAPYMSLLERGFATVTGFEPQPQALAELVAVKGEAEDYLPHAIGAGRAERLNLYRQSGFSSLFEIDPKVAAFLGFGKGTRATGNVDLTTQRLDDVVAPGSVDFLKIDVQGSELAVISNATKALSQAVLLQVEVRFLPLYQGEPSFGVLEHELHRQGFFLHDFAFLKRSALPGAHGRMLRRKAFRQVIDGDAYFVRDLTRAEAMTDAQVWRLAMLAEGVMMNPSLVLFCLDLLAERGAIAPAVADGYVAALPVDLLR